MNQLETKRAIAKAITKPVVNTTQEPHSVAKETTQQLESLAVILPNSNLPTAKRTVVLQTSAPKAKSLVKELLVKNVTLMLNPQQQISSVNALVASSQQTNASEAVAPAIEKVASILEAIPSTPKAVKSSPQIIKTDTPPEIPAATELASTKHIPKAPTQSPPLEVTMLNMSATAKADLLKIHEDEFTKHRYCATNIFTFAIFVRISSPISDSNEFLNEMNDMHRSVCAAQQSKRKQFALELHLERLRAQVAQCETALTLEKDNISKLYPCISASRQNILKRRMKSTELSSTCQRIGVAISGTSYR